MFCESIPEHLSCAFVGTNTPVVLRFEVATESGGMMIEEYKESKPFITLYGDVAEAKKQFRLGLEGLADYLISLERYSTIRSDACLARSAWFQMELRVPGRYRATLYSEGDDYRFSYMLASSGLNIGPVIEGMKQTYDRLKAVYNIFFNTEI